MELHSAQFGVYSTETNSIDVDNLCLEAFRTCEAKYWRQIVQGLVPMEDALALAFGKALHAGRAAYRSTFLKNGPASALDFGILALETEWNASMPPEMKTDIMANDRRSLTNAKHLFEGYANKYLQHGEPLAVEIVDGNFLGESPEYGVKVYYHYAQDELCLFDGKKYTREVKTTSYSPETQFLEFQTSAAITGYIWGASQHFGESIYASIVDLIWVHLEPKKATGKTKPFSDYFKMDIVHRSTDQIEMWKHNTLVTVDDMVRSHKRNYYRLDQGKACIRFNKCTYYDIHSADPSSWENIIEQRYKVQRWNPYTRS
mgnify:CR=1 FL=1